MSGVLEASSRDLGPGYTLEWTIDAGCKMLKAVYSLPLYVVDNSSSFGIPFFFFFTRSDNRRPEGRERGRL